MSKRSTPPPVRIPVIPRLEPARHLELANGLKVVLIDGVEAPVLSVEMIWDAGRPYERKRLVDGVTNELLTEGTRHRSATKLEAFFEQYGTHLKRPSHLDTGNLALSTVTRLADRTLPVMAEVIAEPAFSERSFTRLLKRRRQSLKENLRDPDTIAYRMITEAVFGSDTPYGYNGYQPDYDALTLEDVRAHHADYYHAGNATLMVVGSLDDRIEQLLEGTFGQLPAGKPAPAPAPLEWSNPSTDASPAVLQHHRPKAAQTMIRRGRRGIVITDPDYAGLVVLDTIFGGYFGSRLMQNIREEKGYTYGIDSDLEAYRFDGSFGVSADVANENLDAVRREIGIEMDKLRQEPVPLRELDMVRSYLIGHLVMDMDGRLATSRRHRSALLKQYDPAAHLLRLDEVIRNITPTELQDLAQRYLRPELDWEVIVGGADPLPEARQIKTVRKALGIGSNASVAQ